MSEVEAKKDVPVEEKTAEELKGTKRAAEVRGRAVKSPPAPNIPRPRCVPSIPPWKQ